jgi:hypothetical protein
MQELRSQYRADPAIDSVIMQLKYLIAWENGHPSSAWFPEHASIGLLAAREIEALDSTAADVLYKVAAEVDRLQRERSER